jgi:hypothetical protein
VSDFVSDFSAKWLFSEKTNLPKVFRTNRICVKEPCPEVVPVGDNGYILLPNLR